MNVDAPKAENTAPDKNLPPLLVMKQRRETMADGRRYIIYYTFDESGDKAPNQPKENLDLPSEVSQNV